MIIHSIKDKNDGKLYILLGIIAIFLGMIISSLGNLNSVNLIISLILTFIVVFVVTTCLVAIADSNIKEYIVLTIYSLTLGLISTIIIYDIVNVAQYPLWITIISIIGMTELLFLFDKKEPSTIEKDKLFEFTIERKIEALFESMFIFFGLKSIYDLFFKINYKLYYPIIMEGLKDIFLILVVIIGIYVYIKINTLKYRKD